MATEIERKYLVKKQAWQSYKEQLLQTNPDLGTRYSQGYVPTTNATTVRVRIAGTSGYLTIKSKVQGYTRMEFEYPIPLADAEQMLETLCLKPFISKIRYKVDLDGLTWEVDEFLAENAGLIVAEVELARESQEFILPTWIDREVRDRKYFNSNLIRYPYSQWQDRT